MLLLVRINILKFENRSSKNERILLARFIFSLLALVLRRYSSTSFADWPSGGYLLPKSSRAPDFISSLHATIFAQQSTHEAHYIVVHSIYYYHDMYYKVNKAASNRTYSVRLSQTYLKIRRKCTDSKIVT